MICTTTTPFQLEDITSVVCKPTELVAKSWQLLRPHFGVQIAYGCGRLEALANFFDVVAISVLATLLEADFEAQQAIELAIGVAEETSLSVEELNVDDISGSGCQHIILNDVIQFLKFQERCIDSKMPHQVQQKIFLSVFSTMAKVIEATKVEPI